MAEPRVLFHVQHLLGVGHRARARRSAVAARDAGLDVALTAAPDEAVPAGIEAVRLPAIRAADAAFSGLVDADGRPVDDALWAARRAALTAALADAPPDVLLVEGYPFARRALRHEIDPLIEAARAAGAVTACSVRDILVRKPDPARNAAVAARAAALHDAILVHGDPTFVRLEESFPPAAELADRIAYTGYVAPPPVAAAESTDGPAPVIVSVGGGAVGAALLRAALGARAAGAAADRPWRLLGGPNLPGDIDTALRAEAAALPGVTLEPALDGDAFRRALAGAALSVSQAGYNTVTDLWRTGPRAVLIPFAGDGGETEQPLRARRLAERGMATVLPEAALTPARLAEAIEAALAAPPPGPPGIDLDGAVATAEALASLAARRALR